MMPDDHSDSEADAMPQAATPQIDKPDARDLATPRMEIAALKEENARLAVRRREVERENARLKERLRDARALAAVRLVALDGVMNGPVHGAGPNYADIAHAAMGEV